MTPEEVADRLAHLVADDRTAVSVSVGDGFARGVVDVPADRWAGALLSARDDAALACDFFDYLCGVDETGSEGGEDFAVVAHLWSISHKHGVLVRTRVPRDTPHVESVVDVYPGAAWHEREAAEMYGLHFDGHPGGTDPLLLPDGFEGHPLRKDFVLASRVVKPWPGAKEPGESDSGAPSRRRVRPPGVPSPEEWGPDAVAP
ncbi:MAG TPA: NADH-quinone oxidoreductase subunit C [Mycobacteriales bacterium]|jgi:NADH-quinone oxidoreductase subunit C